jgi:serine/threonine protein phosphatase PrpC
MRVWLKSKPLPGLAMSRSVGDMCVQPVGVTEEPEIKVFGSDLSSESINGGERKLAEDRFIVVASDGIWDRFSNEEVLKYVVNGGYWDQKDP